MSKPDTYESLLRQMMDSLVVCKSRRHTIITWEVPAYVVSEVATRRMILDAESSRLRVPTGLSDAEILERAADILSKRDSMVCTPAFMRHRAQALRSEQNTQKPTKEKDANGI